MTARKRVAILISGRGSNMAALIEAAAAPDYPAEIVCVVSNRPNAAGVTVAQKRGIPTLAIDPPRTLFEDRVHRFLAAADVELVALAGFMRLLTPRFVDTWRDRILNIHPSLLPAFRGLNTHERALAAGVKITGATVHIVRPEMDDGPIIAQAAVPVLAGDTAGTLGSRVLAAEHELYPLALGLYASGHARLESGRIKIDGTINDARALFSPNLRKPG